MSEPEENSSESGGFLSSLGRLADQLVHLLVTKLELFQIEVEEELRRIFSILVLFVSAVIIGHLAFIALTLTLVAVFWDYKILILGIVTLLYAGSALILGLVVRHKLKSTRTKLFSTTLSELRKDREWLRNE